MTDWKTDLTSINQFGRIENVVLDMSLTSSAANSKAETLVNTLAWPTVTPPDEYTIGPAQDISDRLQLSLMGYIFTAGWRYCPLIGTTDVTAIIQALIATQSDYLVEGTIDQNDMEYQIDDRLPLSLWTVASEAALAGDETGARWSLLCHNQREIDYLPTSLETLYHLRNNRIYNLSGPELEPWEIEPAWMELHDAPQVSQVVTGSGYDELQPPPSPIREARFAAGRFA